MEALQENKVLQDNKSLEDMTVGELFERLFYLENLGELKRAQIVRSHIELKIKGSDVYILNYIKTIKRKPVYINLVRILKGDNLDGFELALFVSSMITHQLIEAIQFGVSSFISLKVLEQTKLLYDFEKGLISEDNVNDYYRQLFNSTFFTS